MGERADEPDKIEKPEASNSPASESSAGPGGSTEHKLPVVWSPKLDAGAGIEDEFFDADPAPPPPDDEAVYGEAAKDEPSAAAAPAAQPRSWRFAMLAATIAVAAAVGSFVGSLTGAGVGRLVPEAAPSADYGGCGQHFARDESGARRTLRPQSQSRRLDPQRQHPIRQDRRAARQGRARGRPIRRRSLPTSPTRSTGSTRSTPRRRPRARSRP